MPARTIRLMIVEDLGYCCPAAFLTLYKQTSVVAARLGVSTRAIKYHKAALRRGELRCENCSNCLVQAAKKVA